MGLQSYDRLQEELERARTNLRGLNDNIRRIVGRDPVDSQLRNDRKRTFSNETRNDNRRIDATGQSENRSTDKFRHRDISPLDHPSKRRPIETKSVFSRLSGPVRDEEHKPRLHSRVIKEVPTKQEIVAAQGIDEASKARNRRMFGSLLGTLQKFCQEESRQKPKEEKKAKIEQKLEAQQLQERENMKKERQNMFVTRKQQQLEIRMLELKMHRLGELKEWEESKKPLNNFIRTKAKPHIYFKPKTMDARMEKKLQHSRSLLQSDIEKRRADLQEELQAIEARYKLAKPEKSGDDEDGENRRRSDKHDRRNHDEEDDEMDGSLYQHSDDGNEEGELAEMSILTKQYDCTEKSTMTIKQEGSHNNHKANNTDRSEVKKLMKTEAVQPE